MTTRARSKSTLPRRARGLSAARIAETALGLIDSEGPSALSARRIAAELGCEAMSLYHHVDGMEGVLDLVVDRVLGALPLPAGEESDWRRAARDFASGFMALACEHPHAMRLVAGRLWRTPAALGVADAAIRLFRAGGFSPREALAAARVLGAYLNGAALALAAGQLAGEDRNSIATADLPDLRALASASNAAAVGLDLDAGVELLLDAIALRTVSSRGT